MTTRSAQHDTFVIERPYAASPARVFAAWADQSAKFRWFASLEGWDTAEYSTGTRLTYTEQGVFLDGYDTAAQREQGMADLLNALDAELQRVPTTV